jgi:hypothetical protein
VSVLSVCHGGHTVSAYLPVATKQFSIGSFQRAVLRILGVGSNLPIIPKLILLNTLLRKVARPPSRRL